MRKIKVWIDGRLVKVLRGEGWRSMNAIEERGSVKFIIISRTIKGIQEVFQAAGRDISFIEESRREEFHGK